MTAPHAHGHLTLPFGRFYGCEDTQWRAPGLSLSLLRVDPHRVVERHSHDEAHLVLVLDGLYVSSAEGAPPVSAGTALVFNPAGTMHRDRFESRGGAPDGRFLTLSITADLIEAARDRGALPQRPTAITRGDTVSLALRLATTAMRTGDDAALQRDALSLALLSALATTEPPHTPTRGAPGWLVRAREHLDDAVGGEVQLADVARSAGVHRVHLARAFREHLGITPADYLRRRRLEHARVLLRETSRPLSDIALACGFSDQPHFTHAFRRQFGAPPAAFRRSSRTPD